MKVDVAIEIFRDILEEQRNDNGTMCNQPYFCKAFPKDEERPKRCPYEKGKFGRCETCDRVVAFDTIVDFVNAANAVDCNENGAEVEQ